VSFDNTTEPLEFALKNSADLGYLAGFENQIAGLLRDNRVEFENGKLLVKWEFHPGDFPAQLNSQFGTLDSEFSEPHAIFYDAFSPAKNPAMWTLPLFQNLFRALSPAQPCALTTYSRSTLIRATLLLAGFFVGIGRATGLKEETTIAANTLNLIAAPLGHRWLERAKRSHSAEPMLDAVYRRAPLTADSLKKLQAHPQFQL
jgi:hypothetical protein